MEATHLGQLQKGRVGKGEKGKRGRVGRWGLSSSRQEQLGGWVHIQCSAARATSDAS